MADTDKDKKAQDDKKTPPGEGKDASDEAAAAAKKAAEGADGSEDPKDIPETLKPYIDKLRKESATYRTKNKELTTQFNDLNGKFSKMDKALKKLTGVETDKEVDPDELASALSQERETNQTLQLRASVLEIAVDHEIVSRDAVDYLGYLIEKSASELKEGEELSEEDISGLVKKVKTQFGTKKSSTSVEDKKDPPPSNGATVTVEQFSKMTITEKSLLFQKNAALYEQLLASAKEKRLFV